MKNNFFYIVFFLVFISLSCKRIEKKLTENHSKRFSVNGIVKDFKDDKTINEIEGIQVEDLFYKEYFVYTGNQKRVISGINKINSNNHYSTDCSIITKEEFNKAIVIQEKNKQTAFFWKFEKLKDVEYYTCTKALNRHFIIFDLNSDTVYHRVEEIMN